MTLGAPLEPAELAPPAPGPGEVLLRVHACGVNFADTLLAGVATRKSRALPFTPGLGGLRHGRGARRRSGAAAGTRVVCLRRLGRLRRVWRCRPPRCVPAPDGYARRGGGGLPVAYGTSHVALACAPGWRPGETLLVLGAAGGVGLTAVELGA